MKKIMDFIVQRKKIFIPLFFVLLLIIIINIYPTTVKLKVVTTLPQNNQNEIPLDSKIVIIFNKKVKFANLSLLISPSFDYSIEENNEKITIIPKTKLIENLKYIFDIKTKIDKDFFYSFSFSTQKITGDATEKVISEQGEPNFYEEARVNILKNYPLFDYIPYKTEKFSIDYIKPLTLEIVSSLPQEEISTEINNWITSKGVNPKTHIIKYK